QYTTYYVATNVQLINVIGISTTNHLERYLEEIRRRIKVQGYFKNPRSMDYWVYGIIQHIDRDKQPEGMLSSPMGEESKELITDSRLRGNDILESAHNS
ncbi:MAG: transposase, partial [Candidatus Omnitrophota bacterium]